MTAAKGTQFERMVRITVGQSEMLVTAKGFGDTTTKIGESIGYLYQVPGFFLDRPYRDGERELSYFVGEPEEIIALSPEIAGLEKVIPQDQFQRKMGVFFKVIEESL